MRVGMVSAEHARGGSLVLARRRARVVTGEWGELCGWSGGEPEVCDCAHASGLVAGLREWRRVM